MSASPTDAEIPSCILTSKNPSQEGGHVRITSKGQVTIPIGIRERLGFLPDTEVDFVVDDDSVRIVRRADRAPNGRGERVVRRLRGTGSVRMTTDQIMALTRK